MNRKEKMPDLLRLQQMILERNTLNGPFPLDIGVIMVSENNVRGKKKTSKEDKNKASHSVKVCICILEVTTNNSG